MKINLNKILRENLRGKVLEGLEFGGSENPEEDSGERQVSVGSKIQDARVVFDGEDVMIIMDMSDGTEAYAYANEDIEYS